MLYFSRGRHYLLPKKNLGALKESLHKCLLRRYRESSLASSLWQCCASLVSIIFWFWSRKAHVKACGLAYVRECTSKMVNYNSQKRMLLLNLEMKVQNDLRNVWQWMKMILKKESIYFNIKHRIFVCHIPFVFTSILWNVRRECK